jgi:hypothetical protein
VLLSALGCHDETGVQPPAPPRSAVIGEYMVHVNTRTMEITTTPVPSMMPAAGNGVHARLYGGASQIKHWFTVPAGFPMSVQQGQKSLYALQDRLENLLPYAIGTHVAHAAGVLPRDTMGVYVFITVPPVPTCTAGGTTGSCAVAVDSADGTAKFTSSTGQPYWYWKTILEKSDGVAQSGLDYSGTAGGVDYHRDLYFLAGNHVTDFVFGIAVSAPWTPPNGGADTAWTVRYSGDSLPNRKSFADLRSEPDWRILASTGLGGSDTTITSSSCPGAAPCLQLTTQPSNTTGRRNRFSYYRSDSLGSTQDAYMTATFNGTLRTRTPTVVMAMQNGTKLIQAMFAADTVFFSDSLGNSVQACPHRTGTETSWRLTLKNGNGALYTPASSTNTIPWCGIAQAVQPASPYTSSPKPFFWFGNLVPTGGTATVTRWSDVTYAIGAWTP